MVTYYIGNITDIGVYGRRYEKTANSIVEARKIAFKMYIRDYERTNNLSKAEIGIYSDSKCKKLIGEVYGVPDEEATLHYLKWEKGIVVKRGHIRSDGVVQDKPIPKKKKPIKKKVVRKSPNYQ